MVRKIKAKAVLRLDGQGLSGRAMARSLGIARQSVSGTPGAAKTAGVGWDDVCICLMVCVPVGGQDHADRRPGHRGLVNRVPVCRRAAVRPVRVRGARFGHDAEHVAAGPCGGVRVVRRLHAPSGVRRSQDRRDQAPA